MGVYLGNTKIGLTVYEKLNKELTEQETLLNELEVQVDELKDISNEIITITENGEYDVKNYGTAVVSIGGGIEVELPEKFAEAGEIYHFIVNDNTILFSDKSVSGIGVWVYKIKEKTWNQAYTKGSQWNFFMMAGNNCLIGGINATGILLYNSTDDSIIQVHKNGTGWRYLSAIDDNKFLLGGTTTDTGLLLYNANNNNLTKIYSNGHAWRFVEKIKDNNYLISSFLNNAQGILHYNSETNEINQIYSSGNGWNKFVKVNDTKWLICGDNANNSGYAKGVLLYDSQNNTINQIYTTGYCWIYIHRVGNNYLISSSYSSNSLGILRYNSIDDSIEQIYSIEYAWQYFQTIGDKCLVSTNNGLNTGVLLYNSTSDSIEQIYSSGYRYMYFQIIGNKCLISSQVSNGVLVYDSNTNEVHQVYTRGPNWGNFKTIGDKCLISNKSSTYSGLLVYNSIDDTVVVGRGIGIGYDIFKEVDGNCYVECSDKLKNPYTLYYNSVDGSVKVVGCLLEV